MSGKMHDGKYMLLRKIVRKARSVVRKIRGLKNSPRLRRWNLKFIVFCRRWRRRKYKNKFGLNLIGYVTGEFGLGESCRLILRALQGSGIPYSVKNVSAGRAANENDKSMRIDDNDGIKCINLIHVNAAQMADTIYGINRKNFINYYNIAFWLWEVPEYPEEWNYVTDLFDEIWTPSDFVTEIFKKCTDKPVVTIPYGFVTPQTDEQYDRKFFGLPNDRILYMISYDAYSVSERKNPYASINAFKKAFSPKDKVGLIIKATHAKKNDIKKMRKLLEGYSVYILPKNYTKVQFNSLIKAADVYVSLHRAEGFGLVMAEAMLLGTAVIATNWSANTQFMNSDTACMVDADIIEMDKEYPPYHRGYHWADPDVAQASEHMKKLYEDSDYRKNLTIKAKQYMSEYFSVGKSAEKIEQRMAQLKTELECQ